MGWDTFFKYKNSGATDMWTEHLQIQRGEDGRYDLRIYNPPTAPDHEQFWIEWRANEPSKASGLLKALIEALDDRGLRIEVGICAALAVRGELRPADVDEVERCLATLLSEQPSLLDWLKEHRKTAAKELQKIMRQQSRKRSG